LRKNKLNSIVIEANKKVHSSLILSGEYQKSPHRKPEATRRVQSLLASLDGLSNAVDHLDIGCGDGFIFECSPKFWKKYGVDITPEMLKICTENHPDAKLAEGYAENIPFPDASFDVVTCYSFLDHLESTNAFFSEALRVLKPGGYFYFGLSPNRNFYKELIETSDFKLSKVLMAADLALEYKKAFDDGSYYESQFGINSDELRQCEPGKSIEGGLCAKEESSKLLALGARNVSVHYEWVFLQNQFDEKTIGVLQDFLPFTNACFKYFDLIGKK
jgi:SAM-dependent methyltransferase